MPYLPEPDKLSPESYWLFSAQPHCRRVRRPRPLSTDWRSPRRNCPARPHGFPSPDSRSADTSSPSRRSSVRWHLPKPCLRRSPSGTAWQLRDSFSTATSRHLCYTMRRHLPAPIRCTPRRERRRIKTAFSSSFAILIL